MREAIARCCSLLREQGQSHCIKRDGALVGLKLERGGCSALLLSWETFRLLMLVKAEPMP